MRDSTRSRTSSSYSSTARMSARGFYRLLNRLSDYPIPEDVGDFRLLDRQAVAKAGGGIVSTVRATRAASEEELFDSASARLATEPPATALKADAPAQPAAPAPAATATVPPTSSR